MSDKLTVPEVLPIAIAYVAKSGNSSGGSLHIVLDDYNVETSHIEFCRQSAEERGDTDGVELAELLMHMSKTQRLKVAHRCWEPIGV